MAMTPLHHRRRPLWQHAEAEVNMNSTTALNDRALTTLSWLIEQPVPHISPDGIWLSGEPDVYEHLLEQGALFLSHDLSSNVLCHECCDLNFRPQVNLKSDSEIFPYRGYCPNCGWVDLTSKQARLWQAHPVKIARWLHSALQLGSRYVVEPVVDGVLWRLGEREHRRKRRSFFFGRQLSEAATAVGASLIQLSVPGSEVIFTFGDTGRLRNSSLSNCTIVPMRSVVHLRKSGFVIENLDSYLNKPLPIDSTNETSLRPLRTQQAVLIAGELVSLPEDAALFLQILDDAEGEEVHKQWIAEHMGKPRASFKAGNIFRRHKNVRDTFVITDERGRYRIKEEYVTAMERGEP
jgi:hypothetical protein